MIINKYADLLLIKFPIYLPVVYFICIYYFPNYEYLIIFITLCLLAEPHFGATWPFFLSKVNYEKISLEKSYYIYLPIIIVLTSIISYFYINYIFLIFFFAVNLFHVTRQSSGISKLYIKNTEEIKFQINTIYLFGVLFFFVGLMRFYGGFNSDIFLLILNAVVITAIISLLIFYFYRYGINQNVLLLITGVIIFYPMCFVSKPIHGIIMGVTMHYIQYIALTYTVIKNRNKKLLPKESKNYKLYFITIIFLYGSIMASFSFFNNLNLEIFKYFILIPILGQLLHFYLDALLWKFSDPHNRQVTLRYLKS